MKIAVATIDGIALSQHFGQSKGFVVFDVEDSTVRSRELRTNADTPHNQGICNHAKMRQPHTATRGFLSFWAVAAWCCAGAWAEARPNPCWPMESSRLFCRESARPTTPWRPLSAEICRLPKPASAIANIDSRAEPGNLNAGIVELCRPELLRAED